jgi:hypothetical protein
VVTLRTFFVGYGRAVATKRMFVFPSDRIQALFSVRALRRLRSADVFHALWQFEERTSRVSANRRVGRTRF